MKAILFTSVLFFSISLHSQNGAAMEFKMTSSKGGKGSMKVAVSEFGSVSEFTMAIPQMPGGGMSNKSLVKNSTPDVIYMLDDKEKKYSEIKKSDPADDQKTYTASKMPDETINGYKCSHAIVTDGKETHEVWNTKDIKEYDKYSEIMKNNKRMSSPKREEALKKINCDGFPVKMLHKGNEREGDMTVELVKFDKKTFSKSDFEIPEGYTKSEAGSAPAGPGAPQMKSQQEIMNMSPEERAKYIEEMKKKYGK
jgi:hypothetical protein